MAHSPLSVTAGHDTQTPVGRGRGELRTAFVAFRSVAPLAAAPLAFQALFAALALLGWPRAGVEHRVALEAPASFLAGAALVALSASSFVVLVCAAVASLRQPTLRAAVLGLVALLAVLPVPLILFFLATGTLPSLDLAREGLPFLLRDRTGWGRAGLATLIGVAAPWLILTWLVLRAASRPPAGSVSPRPLAVAGLLLLGASLAVFGGGTILAFLRPGPQRTSASAHQLLTCILPPFPLVHPAASRNGGEEELARRLERELRPRGDLDRYFSSLRATSGGGRPNIVVVMLEGVPAGHVGFFGYHRATTPSLDRLAGGGVSFPRAYSVANESKNGQTAILASVLPMRGSQNNFVSHPLDYPRVLCWDVFRALGYRTAFVSTQDESWLGMLRFQLLGGTPPDLYLHALQIPEGETFPDRKKDEGPVVRRAIDWMTRAAGERAPFLLITNFQRTHFPYQLPRNVEPRFRPVADLGPRFRRWTEADLPDGINNFDSALWYVDQRLGELLEAVRGLGIERDTIVAVVSDHGQGFEPGLEPVSMSLEEPYVRIPLVISWPGRLEPRRVEADVSSVDLFPTLVDLVGAPPCPAWEGDAALRAGAEAGRPRPVYSGSIVWESRWLARGPRGQVLADLATGRALAFRRDTSLKVFTEWSAVPEAPALLGSFLEDFVRRTTYYESPALRRSRLYSDSGPSH